jgi:hypothetical protein
MLNETIHYLTGSLGLVWNFITWTLGFLVAAFGYTISAIAALMVPAICLIVGTLIAFMVPYFIIVICLELLNAITSGFVKNSNKALIGSVLIGTVVFMWFFFSGLLAWADSESLIGFELMVVGVSVFFATYAWVEVVTSLRDRQQPIDPSAPKSIPEMLAQKS